ncbi:MAG TPA: LLM class flavin-dependent oxidoreductase [Segeticoccus sp.]|uniref:LLM class flavin-dependent oxidoreductase n=1 Tax=Segeticoccus sp. TaxID=2706531 RepID=UPI002D7F97AD|nr:LLM class flavin-dependent oxidoreductase [Segeticoccus sp.]HET8599114.1 LLM class flavin-dependent oxidoreductase [Segeticoccus sp.]
MRFGVVILPEHPWTEARHLWRRAEELGFDHAWTYDHLTWAPLPDAPWFGAVPTLAAAALVTTRVRLGTYVASPNFRHPVPFAQELMSLDDLSDGRLLVGLGSGGDLDAGALHPGGLSRGRRTERFADFVELLDPLLRGERVSARGRHFSAGDVRLRPGCRQRPRAPFVVSANGPRAMEVVARHGEGWVTTGVPSDDPQQWWATVARLAARLDDVLEESNRAFPLLDRYLSLDASGTFSLSSVAAFEDAVGRAADLGFTDVVCHWPRSEGPYAGHVATLERVASEVLPRWRDQPG